MVKSDDWAFFHSKDLIVPWHFSLRFQTQYFWFWPFYSYGPLFAKRNDIITWRGSTTSPWMTGPRFELIRRFGGTKIHPLKDELTNTTEPQVDADFAFIKVVQKPPGAEALSKQQYRFSKRHQFYKQMQKYKYVLDVDGNGFTSRFPGLLRSGSVVFKSTRFREWFHGILQPYQHYIPVNYNLTDLVEKVSWAHQHPEQARQIAHESRQRVEQSLRPVDMQCYMYRLALEYQQLFE